VDGDRCDIGTVRVRLDPDAGKPVAAWSLRGLGTTELDGLATTISQAPERDPAEPHPNGVSSIDHVVAFTPDLDRSVAVLQGAGLDLRRVREQPTPAGAPRQAFFRLAEVILEVVQMPDAPDLDRSRNAHLWGLAFATDDMDTTVAALGARVGAPKDAAQEGRQVATLRSHAGSSVPIAFMTRPPAAAGR
jgi:hypothetical protein